MTVTSTSKRLPLGLFIRGALALAVIAITAGPAAAQNKYKELIFINNWTGAGEAITVTSGTDTFTYTAAGPGNAADCAAAFAAAATAPFTVQMANNNPRGLRICHPTARPTVEKVMLKNYRCYSSSYFTDPTAALASTNLIEVRGVAAGGGMVSLIVEDLVVMVPTTPGQTAEEIVNLLMADLDAITPDDVEHSFGTEFTAAAVGAGPLDSVDIGIWALGTRDLSTTFFESTDPGIMMTQEAVVPDACVFVEDFELYAPGSGLHGLAGWKGWDDDPAFDAPATASQARASSVAVDIKFDGDLVHEHCTFDEGEWSFEAWQYIPSDFVSGSAGGLIDGSYFMLLNTYYDGGPYNWSVMMAADSPSGMMKVFQGDGLSTMDVPYDTDRWVKIQVLVDKEEDWTQVYYDNDLVTEYPWTGGVLGAGGGALDIAAVDLFANGSTSIYYDDLTLEPSPRCEGDVADPPDGQRNVADLLEILAKWGTSNPNDDFAPDGGDGIVDVTDLLRVLALWGVPCP